MFSKVVSKDYVRTKFPNGSYKPEEYLIKNAGRYDHPYYAPDPDASMDNKSFSDVARVVVEQLWIQNYRLCTDKKTAKLIIVVRWGTSTVPDSYLFGIKGSVIVFDSLMYNPVDEHNAALLGYDWEKVGKPSGMRFVRYDNELLELEGDRYFVVLMAYDCQAFLKQKKYKELWETRFSVSTRDTDFTKALPKMAKDASGYFGRDSNGLQHLPEGKVNVGEVKSLGEVEAEPPQK